MALRAIVLPDKGYSRHMKFLRNSCFPMCPIQEQHRIVAKLDSLFERQRHARDEFERAIKLLDRFDQALLGKAFSGQLLPQDPNEEAALLLVELIQRTGRRRQQVKG